MEDEKSVKTYKYQGYFKVDPPSSTHAICINCRKKTLWIAMERELTTIGIEMKGWYICNECSTERCINFGIVH